MATWDGLKSLEVVLNDSVEIVLLHYYTMMKNIGYGLLNVLKIILYLLYDFQTYPNVRFIYQNTSHTQTTNYPNIELIYETYKDKK